LIRCSSLQVFRVAGALELGLDDNQPIPNAVIKESVDAPVVTAVDQRPDADGVFGPAQTANSVGR
jgi:hypothetical protein